MESLTARPANETPENADSLRMLGTQTEIAKGNFLHTWDGERRNGRINYGLMIVAADRWDNFSLLNDKPN